MEGDLQKGNVMGAGWAFLRWSPFCTVIMTLVHGDQAAWAVMHVSLLSTVLYLFLFLEVCGKIEEQPLQTSG